MTEAKFQPAYVRRDHIFGEIREERINHDREWKDRQSSVDFMYMTVHSVGNIGLTSQGIKQNKRFTLGERSGLLHQLRIQLVKTTAILVAWIEHVDVLIAQEQVKSGASRDLREMVKPDA